MRFQCRLLGSLTEQAVVAGKGWRAILDGRPGGGTYVGRCQLGDVSFAFLLRSVRRSVQHVRCAEQAHRPPYVRGPCSLGYQPSESVLQVGSRKDCWRRAKPRADRTGGGAGRCGPRDSGSVVLLGSRVVGLDRRQEEDLPLGQRLLPHCRDPPAPNPALQGPLERWQTCHDGRRSGCSLGCVNYSLPSQSTDSARRAQASGAGPGSTVPSLNNDCLG